MRTLTTLLSLGLALAAAACSPYSPDLSDRPFLCGDSPKCPDGFEAKDNGGTCICTRPAGGGGDDCEDQYEPNNVTTQAFQTPVGMGSSTVTLTDPIICPATDVDTYSFRTATNNAGAVASITFDSNLGSLGVNIVSADGTPIATGVNTGDMSRATANLASAGTYYVQVVTAGGGEGAYTLSIMLTN